ncbi:hypothetical protein ONZ45_g5134 [Pleurotus djamor]|nr:hypothetical protein ONZ45_g5134 [Pleurotus djamor]
MSQPTPSVAPLKPKFSFGTPPPVATTGGSSSTSTPIFGGFGSLGNASTSQTAGQSFFKPPPSSTTSPFVSFAKAENTGTLASPPATASPFASLAKNPTTTESQTLSKATRHHERYYFEDGTTTLQVEDVQFRLHRGILHRYCPELAKLVVYKPVAEPHILETCLVDFVRLLDVLYPSLEQIGVAVERTPEEWISILKQSHQWKIKPLKDLAAGHVASMTLEPAQRIKLYRECGLDHSADLAPAFTDLCRRLESVSISEAKLLGLETYAQIVTLREAVIRGTIEGSLNDRVVDSFALTGPKAQVA